MSRLSYLVLATACSVLLLSAACGDDDDSSTPEESEEDSEGSGDDDSDADSTSEEDEDDDADGDATEAEDPESDGDSTAAEDGEPSDEDIESRLPGDIEELLGSLDTVHVEYDVSVSGDESFEGTARLTSDEGNFRLDFETDDGSGSVIVTAEASYFCAEGLQEEGSDEEGGCFEFPGGQDLDDTGVPFFELFADVLAGGDEAGVSIEDAEDREVAGEEADCFTILQEEVDGEALICLSAENAVPLLIEGTGEGQEFTLEATEVDDEVDDEDFEPPYAIVDFDFSELDFGE